MARADLSGIALAALAAGLLACAATVGPLPFPAQRVRIGLFSFMPPDEPGWIRTPSDRGDQWGFDAAAAAAHPDETYAFQVFVARIEPGEGPRTDIEIMQKAAEAEGASSERFELQSTEVTPWKGIEAACDRGSFTALDRDPVRRSGSHVAMKLTVVQFACVHPREPRTQILLSFSQRCEPGHEDPTLGEKAESLIRKVEFLETPR